MIQIRRADERGHENHGWLDSYHTFSFADYYDPGHMGFRSLRVINEDRVQGGEGFGTHSHRDFEIISYVISGALEHQDSMGTKAVMRAGDVQRISAGTGIAHSEYNASREELVHFLQIWLVPSRKGVSPNYSQRSFGNPSSVGLKLACSKDGREESIPINQDANVYIGRFEEGQRLTHPLARNRYAWVQLISGDLAVNTTVLSPGDGAALSEEGVVALLSVAGAHFVVFDLN
jgi:redox-sensitive bicupin YhaK (pirin superfamily)